MTMCGKQPNCLIRRVKKTSALLIIGFVLLSIVLFTVLVNRPVSGSGVTVRFLKSEYDEYDASGGKSLYPETLTFLASNRSDRAAHVFLIGIQTNGPNGWANDPFAFQVGRIQQIGDLNPHADELFRVRITDFHTQPQNEIERRAQIRVYRPASFTKKAERAVRKLKDALPNAPRSKMPSWTSLWNLVEPDAEFTAALGPPDVQAAQLFPQSDPIHGVAPGAPPDLLSPDNGQSQGKQDEYERSLRPASEGVAELGGTSDSEVESWEEDNE